MSSPSDDKAPAIAEPEYEWGIRVHAPGGTFHTEWGFNEDPRNGYIDEDGEVEIDNSYRQVLAVGKRLKSPEVWENI